MFSTRNTVGYSVLTSELIMLFGCAGTPTEEEYYEREDAAIQIVSEYNDKARLCRRMNGVLVTSLRSAGKPTRELTLQQMASAECVIRAAYRHVRH